MRTIFALIVLAAVAAFPAVAQERPSYSYVEFDWIGDSELDVDSGIGGGSVDGDGFALAGSAALGESWFVRAAYSSVDLDMDVDLEEFTFQGGWKTALGNSSSDFYAGLGYDDLSISLGSADGDDDGWRGFAGIRGFVGSRVELMAEGALVQYSDSDGYDFRAGGLVAITEKLDITFGYRMLSLDIDDDGDADVDSLFAGVRWNFR